MKSEFCFQKRRLIKPFNGIQLIFYTQEGHFLIKYEATKKENLLEPVYLDDAWIFNKAGDYSSKVTSCKKT